MYKNVHRYLKTRKETEIATIKYDCLQKYLAAQHVPVQNGQPVIPSSSKVIGGKALSSVKHSKFPYSCD